MKAATGEDTLRIPFSEGSISALALAFFEVKSLRFEDDIVRLSVPKGVRLEVLTPFFDLLTVKIVDPPHCLHITYGPEIPLGR